LRPRRPRPRRRPPRAPLRAVGERAQAGPPDGLPRRRRCRRPPRPAVHRGGRRVPGGRGGRRGGRTGRGPPTGAVRGSRVVSWGLVIALGVLSLVMRGAGHVALGDRILGPVT